MIFTALDLEMNQPSRRIIQIGAVAGDADTGQIIDKLSIIINPYEQLSQFIIDLTGIKQDQVEAGMLLPEAYAELVKFHTKNKSFINPVTWGGGDSFELRSQLNSDEGWPFGRRWIDAKTLFFALRVAEAQPTQGGLAKSMTKLGLNFKGRKHDAADDAENTFIIFHKMLQIMKTGVLNDKKS